MVVRARATLDDETALEDDAVAELARDTREEAVENQELAPAREVGPAGRRGAQPGLDGLFERGGGCVGVHAALPRARIAFTSSLSMSARARACSIAASTSSGETCAPAQSINVRRTFVTGTAPISMRSLRGTSS